VEIKMISRKGAKEAQRSKEIKIEKPLAPLHDFLAALRKK